MNLYAFSTTAYGYDESDFVLVQTPFDQLPNTAVSTPGTPMSYNSAVAPIPNMQQYNTTGRGSNVVSGGFATTNFIIYNTPTFFFFNLVYKF